MSGMSAVTGFPLYATDGSAARPSYSFSADTTSGLFITPLGDMTAVSGGTPALSVSPGRNVTLTTTTPPNQLGSGVLYIGEVVTVPTMAFANGGLLFVDGPDLKYAGPTGAHVSLTALCGDVTGPATALNNAFVQFSNATGKTLKSANAGVIAGAVQLPSATPGAPAYSFVTNPTSGMYSSGMGEVAFSTDGVRRLRVSAASVSSDVDVVLPPGSATTPAVNFAAGSGMFHQTSWVSFAVGGKVGITVAPQSVVAFGSSPGVNGAGVVFIDQVQAAPTSATGGVLMWVNGTSLMMMVSTTAVDLTNRIEGPSVATVEAVVRFDGTTGKRVKNSTVVITDTGEVSVPAGTAAIPGYSFDTSTSTGMYSANSGELNLTLQGTTAASFTDTAITTPGRIQCIAGSAVAPGMSRRADPASGFYLHGTSMAASCGGNTGVVISPFGNVSLAGPEATSYGGGQGILFINQAVVDPSTPAADGFLYIGTGDVNNLIYHCATGSTILTNRVCGPPSTTDRYVARFDDTLGRIIIDGTAMVTTTGEFRAPSNASAPTYAFLGDVDTGLTLQNATTLSLYTGGVSSLTLTPLAMVTNRAIVPVGTLSTPSLTFGSDTDTGLYQPGAQMMTFVGGALPSLTAVLPVGATAPNITLGSLNVDYGGGQRVVLIEEVNAAPSGPASGGGRLFVSGTDLMYHDYVGATMNLNNHFAANIGSSVDLSVVRFDGSTGQVKGSAFRINDPTALDYPFTGTAAAPTFSFASDTTSGVYWASGTSLGMATAGVVRLVADSTAVTVPTQPVYAPTLQVGGGLTISQSGVITTQTVGHASGLFEWRNVNTPVLTTSESRNLNTVAVQCTNSTRILSITNTGSGFQIAYPSTTGKLNITIGSTIMATFGTSNNQLNFPATTVITVTNRMLASAASGAFEYDGATISRGLSTTSDTIFTAFGGTRPVYFFKNNCVSMGGLGAIGNSAKGVIFIYDVSTVPSSTGGNNIIFYKQTSSGVFGLGARTNATFTHTVWDGARERATITRVHTVVSGVSTNTDTATWTVEDEHGVNNTTTGDMYTLDDSVVCFTATAVWPSNATGYRRLSIMRKTAGPSYTELASSTLMAVDGDTTAHTVRFLGKLLTATDTLTIQVYQDSTTSLEVSLRASLVRYDTAEV